MIKQNTDICPLCSEVMGLRKTLLERIVAQNMEKQWIGLQALSMMHTPSIESFWHVLFSLTAHCNWKTRELDHFTQNTRQKRYHCGDKCTEEVYFVLRWEIDSSSCPLHPLAPGALQYSSCKIEKDFVEQMVWQGHSLKKWNRMRSSLK